MRKTIEFTVNGRQCTVTTEEQRSLLEVLREEFDLTGTKLGCGEGHCGACTVLVDGDRVHACQKPIGEVAGKSVLTIEGLSNGERLHPVQQAFLETGAFQCGYCTPGMIMATVALLRERPNPSDKDVVTWLNGHLCRCCGYTRIIKAVQRAAEQIRR